MSDTSFDLDFLLKAANYTGGSDAPHSEAARKAVDAVAERLRVVAELQLKVAQEQVRAADPAELAAQEALPEFVLSVR